MVNKFMKRTRLGKTMEIYGDGKQSRTFLHIDDNVKATLEIYYQDLFVNDTVNIGSDESVTITKV